MFTLNIINLEDSTRTELFTGIHGKRAVDTTLVPGLYSVQGYHIGHEPVEIDSLEVGVDTHYHLTVKFDTRMLVD